MFTSINSSVGFRPPALRVSPERSAFATPELLESILLHLDMRSLLVSALGVCRQWRDLIRTSFSLRRALFFEADENVDKQTPEYNSLLVELFPPLFDFSIAPKRDGIDDLVIEALPIGRRVRAFYRRNASWRRMHVRQPPVKHVGVWECTTGMMWSYSFSMVRYPAGLRMEGLYALVLKYSYHWQSSCLVNWTKKQRNKLWHSVRVKGPREPAEEMARVADVVVTADWGGDCMYEVDEEKELNEHGLLTRQGRYFKMKGDKDWETVWEEKDTGLWD